MRSLRRGWVSRCDLSERLSDEERHDGGHEDHQRARSNRVDAVAEVCLAASVRATAHLGLRDSARAADCVATPKTVK